MFRIFMVLVCLSLSLEARYLLLGPMVGHVDEDHALIWCGMDAEGTVKVKFSEKPDLKNARLITVDKFEMGTVKIDGLKPDTRYYYSVAGKGHSKSPVLSFKTAPPKGKSGKVRFLFSSCSGHSGINEDWTWDDISRLKDVDLIFQLGDNHYGDTTDPEIIAKHYFSHRSIGGFRKATGRIPTYGIWDDHDYGPNNSDGQTTGKEGSLAAFKKHWANPAYGEKDNPGIYFTFTRGEVQFIMLDSRYHRTPNKSKADDDHTKTMLGEKQLKWFEKTLKESKAKVKIVGNGSEFQMFSTNDCFTGFKHEQKKVLDLCRDTEGVILISGDRHFTAGYHVRDQIIEITSGPLGSKNFGTRPNPSIFAYNYGGKMFSILDIDTTVDPPKVKWEVHRNGQGVIREMEFSWDEINGKTKIKKQPSENKK